MNPRKTGRETIGRAFRKAGLLLVLAALTACGPQAPDWVGGEGARYPPEDYLRAVESAPEAERARQRAGDVLMEQFAGEIAAAEGARPDWPAGMTQELRERIEIANIWRNEEKGRTFAMAILERQAAADVLQRHLQALDRRLTENLRAAESADDGFSRLERYREALAALHNRRDWAGALSAVRPGSAASDDLPVDENGLQEKITTSVRRLTFGVQTPREEDSTFETGLVRGLAQFGMRLAPDWDRDFLVRAQLQRLDCARTGMDYRCRAEASVDVLGRGGNLLATVEQAAQERSTTQSGARGRTLEKLGGAIAGEIVRRLREGEY